MSEPRRSAALPVRPSRSDGGFSVNLAQILTEYLYQHDRRDALDGEDLDDNVLPFLRGLHAGLPDGDDAIAVRQMIEDIDRHGSIRLTVSR